MAEYVKGDIMTESNRSVEFGEDTHEPCPTCAKYVDGKPSNTLKVRSEIDGTTQLECPNCGHVENRPSNTINPMDLKGRPLVAPK